MRRVTSPHVQIKAAGGVRTLDDLIAVMNLGVTRIGATQTKAMLDDYRCPAARGVGAGEAHPAPGGRGTRSLPTPRRPLAVDNQGGEWRYCCFR